MDNKQYNFQAAEGRLNITYFTDPLCCWSWVFEPVWQQLKNDLAPILNYRYCMGGMIPSWSNYNDDLNSISKPIQMGPIWLQAKHMSGTFINDRLWFSDPPASSYPACAAVKCAALQGRGAAEAYLYMLREAALVAGKNIAKKEVLLDLARKLSTAQPAMFDAMLFEQQITSDQVVENFRKDLNEVAARGITRFPSLHISLEGRKKSVMLTGNRPYDAIMGTIETLCEMKEI